MEELYKKIFDDLSERIRIRQDEERRKRELENEKARAQGIKLKGQTAKPILSPLLINTIQVAFIEGIINEVEFCRRLNIKPDKIDQFIK